MKTTGKWLALCLAILLLTGLCGAQAAEAPARELRFDKTVLELPSAAVEKLSYRYIIAFEGAGDLSGLQLAVERRQKPTRSRTRPSQPARPRTGC